MLNAIATYFRAESLLFAAFGITARVASAYLLWRYGDAMSKGLAIRHVLVGFIQVDVGGGVYLRTPAQVTALLTQVQREPARFKADETERMAKVMTNFKTYKVIEVAFILIGLALTLGVSQPFWLGIGIAVLMLPADITAEQRGAAYVGAVSRM
jgi:hypothetical protein